ncbi:MAG: DUF342 domain-containing protein [bacterium]|nr:DUF342 domain-containing protein [bacterium]
MSLRQQLCAATDREDRARIVNAWLQQKLRQRLDSDLGKLLAVMLRELEEALAEYLRRKEEIRRLEERLDQKKDKALRRESLKKINGYESLIRQHVPVSPAQEKRR